MRAGSSIRIPLMLLRSSAAIAFAIAPYHIAVNQTLPGLELASVLAKDGHSGGGGDHSGDGDHSGSGSSGSSHSGSSGGDDGGNDGHSGPGLGGNDDNAGVGDADDDANQNEHVNPATGARVEIDGNNIEVVHADGTKEEIENGRFEMKNAQGRTIVERAATEADLARLRAFGG
jgi:hypothetical protein